MVQNITLEEAIEMIMDNVSALSIKRVAFMDALGCILAEDIFAPINQPPFNRSPLDGYAVRAEDIKTAYREHPAVLSVVDCVYAGMASKRRILLGEAVKITTGAMLPEGCDAVIRQEDTDYGTKQVAVYQSVKPYQNYCFAGEEYRKGELLLSKGVFIDASVLGVLSGAGIADDIPVYAMPSVAIVCTGNEIVSPHETILPDGKIYGINGIYLQARLKELGVKEVRVFHTADETEKIVSLLQEQWNNYDLIITTGGVSVGEKDLMHTVLPMLGAEQLFWRVLLKPGTPAMFSLKDGKPILSLSGNPFAAAATFELLARPLIAKQSGNTNLLMKKTYAKLQNDFPKASPGRRLIRAIYENGTVWVPETHASGMMQSFIGCNCLVDIPAGSAALSTGIIVQVHLL